jgi:hypothetical protein
MFSKNLRAGISLCLLTAAIVCVWALEHLIRSDSLATTAAVPPRIHSVTVSTNGRVHQRITGQAGLASMIERSTNFSSWAALGTNVFSPAVEESFVDHTMDGDSSSFYRALQPGGALPINAATTRAMRKMADNVPATVSLTNPTNKAAFTALVNVPLEAIASDGAGTVALVEFSAGSTFLGSNAVSTWIWTNAPMGNQALTVRATDNLSCSAATLAVVNATATLPQPDSIRLWLGG